MRECRSSPARSTGRSAISATTTATANDKLFSALAMMRRAPAIRSVPPYYDEPFYIDAEKEMGVAGLEDLGAPRSAPWRSMPRWC